MAHANLLRILHVVESLYIECVWQDVCCEAVKRYCQHTFYSLTSTLFRERRNSRWHANVCVVPPKSFLQHNRTVEGNGHVTLISIIVVRTTSSRKYLNALINAWNDILGCNTRRYGSSPTCKALQTRGSASCQQQLWRWDLVEISCTTVAEMLPRHTLIKVTPAHYWRNLQVQCLP